MDNRQDVRIFGADKKGNPKRRMTSKERLKFWSLYVEFDNQKPTARSTYGSESIQQTLADLIFGDEETAGYTFTEVLNELEKKLKIKKQEENLRSVPNVYSGRGPVKSD